MAGRGEGNDSLGGAVVKKPPANAGDTGSIPDLGRPHVPWSNYVRAQLLQPKSLEPVLPSQSSHQRGKFSTEASEQPPRPTAREKPAQQQTPSTAKSK